MIIMNRLIQNRNIRRAIAIQTGIFVLFALILAWKYAALPPQIPLYYSLPRSVEQLVPSVMIFVFPIVSFILFLFNLIISYFFLSNTSPASYILITSAILQSVFLTISFIRIVFLVTG